MIGDAFKVTVKKVTITTPPQGVIPINLQENKYSNGCCFDLNVFYHEDGSAYKNDYTTVINHANDFCYDGSVEIEKSINGEFVKVGNADNGTGIKYQLGLYDALFNKRPYGAKIEWLKIFQFFGKGTYRFKSIESLEIGIPIVKYSFVYKLDRFDDEKADATVKIEYNLNGVMSDWKGLQRIDFGYLNIPAMVRIPNSLFGFKNYLDESEYISYQGIKEGFKEWIKDLTDVSYKLIVKVAPDWFCDYLRFEVLKGDDLKITDYNKINFRKQINCEFINEYQNVFVILSGFEKTPEEKYNGNNVIKLDFRNKITISDKKRI